MCLDSDAQFIASVQAGIKNPAIKNFLISIDLTEQLNLTDITLNYLAKEFSPKDFPRLREINLYNCNRITDVGLCTLVKNLKTLRVLNLHSCSNITDTSIKTIAQSCPHLRLLNLSYCTDVTADGLIAIAYNCPKIETLYLSHTFAMVTDLSMNELALHCPHLKRIDLGDCFYFRPEEIKTLEDKLPACTIISSWGTSQELRNIIKYMR